MDARKDIINKVSKTVAVNKKRAVGKAKELTEIAALKNQIAACEEVVWKNYIEIGRMVVEDYKKAGEDVSQTDSSIDFPYEKQCRAVINAQAGISDMKRRIHEIKKGVVSLND